jgi:hypothetical protein
VAAPERWRLGVLQIWRTLGLGWFRVFVMAWWSRRVVSRPLRLVDALVVGDRATPLGLLLFLPKLLVGFGGRDRSPGESLALRCQRRRHPSVSFSFLIASVGSNDPLLTRVS